MQFIKTNPQFAAFAFAALAAIFAVFAPDFALAQDVWNAVTTEVAEPAVSMLTQIFFYIAVAGILGFGAIGMLQGNFDIQKMARITAIVFAVVILVYILNDFVRPALTDGIAGATGGSGSGLPNIPNL